MGLIKPFAAIRPTPNTVQQVIAPPYDVMSRSEAKVMALGNPVNFLHVSRAEANLPDNVDAYSPEVYAKAAENYNRLLQEGILKKDAAPGFYFYRMTAGEHQQTGLVALSSIEAYENHQVKRHELTRPVKEQDRLNHMKALQAQTGPVLMAYRHQSQLDDIIQQFTQTQEPCLCAEDEHGVEHALWYVHDEFSVETIQQAFDELDSLYIADGHHRSSAAALYAKETGMDHHFLSVIFPHNHMLIHDYNRVIKDLNEHDVKALLEKLNSHYHIEKTSNPEKPRAKGQLAMYVEKQWYSLKLQTPLPESVKASLDVSLLSQHILAPIFNIKDQRKDPRIDFVGGIRGLKALQKRVDSGDMAIAFALYPTSMDELLSIADAGEIMPPKSTWFEPKLVDGLVVNPL